jgi:type I restriction enzyme R subunit
MDAFSPVDRQWKYPPDQQPDTVDLVLKQAEWLSNEWFNSK